MAYIVATYICSYVSGFELNVVITIKQSKYSFILMHDCDSYSGRIMIVARHVYKAITNHAYLVGCN